MPQRIPKIFKNDDEVVAEFPDGAKYKIPGFTWGALTELTKNPHDPQILYEVECINTHHKVQLKQKVDRHLLLVMVEQKKQVCMVKQSTFGIVPDEKTRSALDHPTLLQAVAFMKKVVDTFARGDADRSSLLKVRDELLIKEGIVAENANAKKSAARKRPSAATLDATAAVAVGLAATAVAPALKSARRPALRAQGAASSSTSRAGPPMEDTLQSVLDFFN